MGPQGQGLVLAAPALQPVHARAASVTVDVAREEGFLQGAAAAGDAGRQGPRGHDAEDLPRARRCSAGRAGACPRPTPRCGPSSATTGRRATAPSGPRRSARRPRRRRPTRRTSSAGRRCSAARLPRLRYGRSYAFRAWGVDLAGNSPPRPDVPPSLDGAVTMAEAAAWHAATAWASRPRRRRASSSPGGRRLTPTGARPAVAGRGAPARVPRLGPRRRRRPGGRRATLVRGLASVVGLAADDETDDVVRGVDALLVGAAGGRAPTPGPASAPSLVIRAGRAGASGRARHHRQRRAPWCPSPRGRRRRWPRWPRSPAAWPWRPTR